MPHYVAFGSDAGTPLLFEGDEAEARPPAPEGVEKAGLRDALKRSVTTVTEAKTTVTDAVQSGVDGVARAVDEAVAKLPTAPAEVEVVFGLKASGEAGNIVVAKLGAEANIEVRLKWVRLEAAAGDT